MNVGLKGKKVLIAGGSGFIGTNLAAKLIAEGAIVSATYHSNPDFHRVAGVDYEYANLEVSTECERVCEGSEVVVMAAANSSGARVIQTTPLVHLTPNVVMNSRMLEASYKKGVQKFVFISSNTVYPVTERAVAEEDAGFEFYEKYEIVAWMKRFSEEMCRMYAHLANSSMDVVVVRPGNLYGPHDKYDEERSKVVAALVRRAASNEKPFVVWGDGSDIKDFLYVEDFCECLINLIIQKDKFNVYNVASGVETTINTLLSNIIDLTEVDAEDVVYETNKPTMIPVRRIDISKIQTKTGWQPKTDLRVGLKQTIDWYKANFNDDYKGVK